MVPRVSGSSPIGHLRAATARIALETAGRPRTGVRHDSADSDVGTFGSDDAIGFDPFPLLAVLQTTGVNYAVFGQVAGILHGSTEPTGDLDVLWDGDPDAAGRLAAALADAGVILRDEDFVRLEQARYANALLGRKTYFEGIGCAGDLCTPRLP